jgi:hypothetical protein
VVTVEDPTHPLYGRRFRVAFRPTRSVSGAHLVVFFSGEVTLRLPVEVTERQKTGQAPRTKVTSAAVERVGSTKQLSAEQAE